MNKIASVFLSHSSQNKTQVKAIADSLGHCGIVPWLDTNCLPPGVTLSKRFEEAIKESTFLVLFISRKAINSDWVNKELKYALEIENKLGREYIIPVFLDSQFIDIIKNYEPLAKAWINEEGLLDRNGINMADHLNSESVAKEISKIVFSHLNIYQIGEANIIVDQRGSGAKECSPQLEEKHKNRPTLVFRFDQNDRSDKQILLDNKWEHFSRNLKENLGTALGNFRSTRPKVHLHGDHQLGISAKLGKIFDRTSHVTIYCYNYHQGKETVFSNDGWNYEELGKIGNIDDIKIDEVFQSNGPQGQEVALLVGMTVLSREKDVRDFLNTLEKELPFIYIQKTPFTHNDQLKQLVGDIIFLVKRLNKVGIQKIKLFTALPKSVVPLIIAYFSDLIPFEFMEYERKDGGSGQYHYLPLYY